MQPFYWIGKEAVIPTFGQTGQVLQTWSNATDPGITSNWRVASGGSNNLIIGATALPNLTHSHVFISDVCPKLGQSSTGNLVREATKSPCLNLPGNTLLAQYVAIGPFEGSNSFAQQQWPVVSWTVNWTSLGLGTGNTADIRGCPRVGGWPGNNTTWTTQIGASGAAAGFDPTFNSSLKIQCLGQSQGLTFNNYINIIDKETGPYSVTIKPINSGITNSHGNFTPTVRITSPALYTVTTPVPSKIPFHIADMPWKADTGVFIAEGSSLRNLKVDRGVKLQELHIRSTTWAFGDMGVTHEVYSDCDNLQIPGNVPDNTILGFGVYEHPSYSTRYTIRNLDVILDGDITNAIVYPNQISFSSILSAQNIRQELTLNSLHIAATTNEGGYSKKPQERLSPIDNSDLTHSNPWGAYLLSSKWMSPSILETENPIFSPIIILGNKRGQLYYSGEEQLNPSMVFATRGKQETYPNGELIPSAVPAVYIRGALTLLDFDLAIGDMRMDSSNIPGESGLICSSGRIGPKARVVQTETTLVSPDTGQNTLATWNVASSGFTSGLRCMSEIEFPVGCKITSRSSEYSATPFNAFGSLAGVKGPTEGEGEGGGGEELCQNSIINAAKMSNVVGKERGANQFASLSEREVISEIRMPIPNSFDLISGGIERSSNRSITGNHDDIANPYTNSPDRMIGLPMFSKFWTNDDLMDKWRQAYNEMNKLKNDERKQKDNPKCNASGSVVCGPVILCLASSNYPYSSFGQIARTPAENNPSS